MFNTHNISQMLCVLKKFLIFIVKINIYLFFILFDSCTFIFIFLQFINFGVVLCVVIRQSFVKHSSVIRRYSSGIRRYSSLFVSHSSIFRQSFVNLVSHSSGIRRYSSVIRQSFVNLSSISSVIRQSFVSYSSVIRLF
jgi:hypothetical protein